MTDVLLVNPKYGHNLGGAVRAVATMCDPEDSHTVYWTGDRIDLTTERGKTRLPREERLRQYQHVSYEHALIGAKVLPPRDSTQIPVAVEIGPGFIPLIEYEHPENAVYVFGPEDGSLSRSWLGLCHHHVVIPSNGCVNLAAAVYLTLYDRLVKSL